MTEAIDLIKDRIEETQSLGAGAGSVLRELLSLHLVALRIQLGNTLARAGDHGAAADQLSTLGNPATIPDDLVFEAARLAHNVRNHDSLLVLVARLDGDPSINRLAALWVAVGERNWEHVLTILDTFDRDDPGRTQTRARALLELDRDRVRTAELLDEAWRNASRPDHSLAIAVTTADLIEVVVNKEEEVPGLDREATVASATERLRAVANAAPTTMLEAFARLRAIQWYAFLDDREWHAAEEASFASLDLSDDQR
ncbi:MAG: hypothetical protein AAGN64_15740, partial [Bacteroidota bacterium]